MPTLTTKLRDFRSERNMTQDDLAKLADVSRKTIVYLEKGEYVPSLYLAWKISQIFGQPIEALFDFTNN